MVWDRGPADEIEERTAVVISRHWGNPEIRITVNQEKIELLTNINDFVDAVLTEIGSPVLLMTKKQLRRRANNAVLVAIEKIKEASAKVM